MKRNKPKVLILVGPPGSGKTYFATRFAANNRFIRINSDDVRESLYPQPQYSSQERKKVYEEMEVRVLAALNNGSDVIFDGNLLANTDRHRIWNEFMSHAEVLFLELKITEEMALGRAMARGNERDPNYEKSIRDIYAAFEPLDTILPRVSLDVTVEYSEMEKSVKDALKKT